MSLQRPQPYGISKRIKPPASLTHTVEQRITHELKTVRRKATAIETSEDPSFVMEKHINLLQFNFAEPALNVDFYPPMEAEVKIFRLHLQRDSIGVSFDVPALRGPIPDDDLSPTD